MAVSNDYPGCCGACILYMSGVYSWTKADFLKQLKSSCDQLTSRGVAEFILTGQQHLNYHEWALEFGAKLSYGPIRNPNSSSSLYGYHINLIEYRNNKLNPVTSVLKKIVNSVS